VVRLFNKLLHASHSVIFYKTFVEISSQPGVFRRPGETMCVKESKRFTDQIVFAMQKFSKERSHLF
jgi:hypothetical protein